ncbi:hypothetical protein SEA_DEMSCULPINBOYZ_60 [Mycobacterium phage Demsculpinboyz]|uniref:Uncharacterized protein n=1 Tax=Mycobacterium phage Demsculpinboyz TaxID=2041528 RepID=A0A2D1G9T8_9CAUD|nr:hypothetical protein I5I02_gp060 [Mycobacterium phage Demsculpinboyz]ATN88655.1 hypothetical protein SEA_DEMSCULPINBOYZ_60 [Mycobacterium phage Demsculpinboyz]
MSDVVERAKVALEGVAYGPWEFDCSDEGMQAVGGPVVWLGDGDLGFRVEAHYQDDRNAEFVAQARTLVPELVAEVERLRPRVIETVEELDALPDFVVVHDRVNTVWEKEWHGGEGPWWQTSSETPRSSADFWLPARVLHNPEADK